MLLGSIVRCIRRVPSQEKRIVLITYTLGNTFQFESNFRG